MQTLTVFSHRELSLWATLVLDMGVAIYYFTSLLTMPGGADWSSAAMAKIIGKIILFSIAYSIIVFGTISVLTKEEKRDERDYRFETRANAIAYYVLTCCVAVVVGHVGINGLFAESYDHAGRFGPMLTPMVIANLLLLALILASAVKTLIQLYHYRRGY